MQRSKIMIQGNGTVTCLSQRESIRRIRELNESEWVEKAYGHEGYIGFNISTGDVDFHPGPTTVVLYEIPKNERSSLSDLQNHFRQDWQRFRHEVERRVKYFYSRNCLIY